MLPLRAFLMTCRAVNDWTVTVHRDLESVIDAWKHKGESASTGVLHVGFSRPDSERLIDLCRSFPGKMLLTAPACYIFERIGPCAPAEAGVVDGLPVYVALSGWGYETNADELGLNLDSVESVKIQPNATTIENYGLKADWLIDFKNSSPNEAEEILSAGIFDDASYLELESILPEVLRITAGCFRFRFLSSGRNTDSPQQLTSIAPPWILNMPIADLDMPVRPYNVLNREGFIFVRELMNCDDNTLITMPKMGRKSVVDIARAIQKAIMVALPGKLQISVDHIALRAITPEVFNETITEALHEPANFENAVKVVLTALKAERSLILRRRMGFHTKRETLQELADTLGITRERVRQIEAQICRKERAKSFWQERLEVPIALTLSERDSPMPILGLTVIDPWFAGVENFELPFEYVLENFGSNRFSLVRTDSGVFVSAINQSEWDSALTAACQLLEDATTLGWKRSEARQNVGALLSGRGEELRDELFYTASKNAIFSAINGSDDPVLTGFGRGAEIYVGAVLAESDRPLHYTEIVERVLAKGREIDVRRAHNAAAEIGLLYGRGTYGLMCHFPLSDDESDEIVAEVEDIVASGALVRQWHCDELCEVLGERGLDMDGRLTPYVVNIALRRSRTLSDLGRLVWTSGANTRLSSANRIEISQAVVSLLRLAGRPMSSQEIRERLHEERGLSQSFQIQPDKNLIRVSAGSWGLADRDVPFTSAQQQSIAEALEAILTETQKGIHLSEFASVLDSLPDIKGISADPKIIASLAQRTGRMRLFYGGYLCLSGWSDARRLKAEDAIRIVLEHSGPEGLRAQDLRENASAILGREIGPMNIYGPLSAVGARYNNSTGYWHLVGRELQEED